MGNQILLVGIGGAVGSIFRYLLQQALNQQQFPYGTLLVNITGCFLIGIFWALAIRGTNGPLITFLVAGFCGGFTTFSTFAFENISLLRSGDFLYFSIYIVASVALGIAGVFAGIVIMKLL